MKSKKHIKSMAVLLSILMMAAMTPLSGRAAPPNADRPVKQPPVSRITMASNDVSGEADDTYNYTLTWNQPMYTIPDDYDNTAVNLAPNNQSFPEWYMVQYRNATMRETFAANAADRIDVTDDDNQPTQRTSKPLAPGSLYEFRVVPYHMNTYEVQLQDGNVNFEPRAVFPAENDSRERRVIFLTDIDVTATGQGTDLLVEWSRPTFNGQDIFDEYEIEYQIYNENFPATGNTIPLRGKNIINVEDCTVNTQTNTLQYLLSTDELRAGWSYHVRVEPRMSGAYVRTTNPNDPHRLVINNVEYYFAYRDISRYEYRTDTPARLSTSLRLDMIGKDEIRLLWDGLSNSPDLNDIDHLEIEEWDPFATEEDADDMTKYIKTIGFINGEESIRNINTWTISLGDLPPTPKAYRLAIYQKGKLEWDQAIRTNFVYYNPAAVDFAPYTPDIKYIAPAADQLAIDLQWLAFARPRYPLDRELDDIDREYNTFIDRNIHYDIYVSDSMQNLNDLTEPLFSATYPTHLDIVPFENINENGTVLSTDPNYRLKTPLSQYVTRDALGEFVTLPIEGNKVYYVKIVAVLEPDGQVSLNPAYGSTYVPPATDLELTPVMIAAPPLRSNPPPTINTITVEWDEKYLEIYRDGGTSSDTDWHAVVGVNASGQLVFGKSAMDLKLMGSDGFIINEKLKTGNPSLYTRLMGLSIADNEDPSSITANVSSFLTEAEAYIKGELQALGMSGAAEVRLRVIDLSGMSYEVHTVEYAAMMAAGGYEAYRSAFLDDSDPTNPNAGQISANWVPMDNIQDGAAAGTKRYTVSVSQNPGGALAENTAYVIYVRPYKTYPTNNSKRAYLPNYISDTTAQYKPPIDIIPPAPVLEAHEPITDMSLPVRWENFNYANQEYDLAYTERLTDGDAGWTVIPWETVSAAIQDKPDRNGKPYLYYTLTNLFPDTTYYIRLRARTPAGESAWSIPVTMKTLDIQAPMPPQGLNQASRDLMEEYNRLNGTDFTPTEEEALNIVWMRDGNDTGEIATAGAATGGTATALSLAELVSMYLVRFEGLEPNRSYYIRAKTVLTVTRTGPGAPAERMYNYIVQVSQDPEFVDYIEFQIPPLENPGAPNSSNFKRKESDWSNAIRLVTTPSDGEYDSDVNPDHYPLPDRDYEITYDPGTQTVTFRFRTELTDATGAQDQQVDQRFISRLIQERVYDYNIDLTSFQNLPVSNRVVILPNSIFTAFDERKITMGITADNATFYFEPGSLNTAAVRSMADFGRNSNIRITISAGAANLPLLGEADVYASQPQKLTVQAITPSRTITLEQFAKPVTVEMELDGRVTSEEKNTGLYTGTPNTGGWEQINHQYDAQANTLTGTTWRSGAFAAVVKPSPTVSAADETRDAMLRVTARIHITDMPDYAPNDIVTAHNFNNLAAAVAYNRASTAIHEALSAADTQALSKAKLLVPANVTQESAAAALATLYELKTKQVARPSATVEDTPIEGIRSAAEANRQNLLKAADMGLIDENFSPLSVLTMGDLMRMLDIILLDAGL